MRDRLDRGRFGGTRRGDIAWFWLVVDASVKDTEYVPVKVTATNEKQIIRRGKSLTYGG